ncbi:hypothetical protein EVAR_9259_1 [Eumeta japonica]|uniref:Uncharacterized protein n=1 Tax=Eumeta variegata TaxID=151549 RepID=A0A4C1TMY2_EUMVA|nr:hypothetical protein EVAR_9259_1 [Eumeta japonica]
MADSRSVSHGSADTFERMKGRVKNTETAARMADEGPICEDSYGHRQGHDNIVASTRDLILGKISYFIVLRNIFTAPPPPTAAAAACASSSRDGAAGLGRELCGAHIAQTIGPLGAYIRDVCKLMEYKCPQHPAQAPPTRPPMSLLYAKDIVETESGGRAA